MKIMCDDLQYLIHFFNDREHLFKTITMVESCQIDEICNKISSQNGWHSGRFSPSERHYYLNRRLFVENELYEGYARVYGHLKESVPVYFYLFPNITKQKAIQLAQQRTRYGEIKPQVLMVRIQDIDDTKNITFTLNDSFTAYLKKAMDSGIKRREEEKDHVVLQDHNKVFPFSMIEQLHWKYQAQEIYYEVQIWDYDLLEKIRYAVLGEEEMRSNGF